MAVSDAVWLESVPWVRSRRWTAAFGTWFFCSEAPREARDWEQLWLGSPLCSPYLWSMTMVSPRLKWSCESPSSS